MAKVFFVRDGINSVADYNSSRIGVGVVVVVVVVVVAVVVAQFILVNLLYPYVYFFPSEFFTLIASVKQLLSRGSREGRRLIGETRQSE